MGHQRRRSVLRWKAPMIRISNPANALTSRMARKSIFEQICNASRFWRIRAVYGSEEYSDWSPVVQITQYDSAYRRIEATGKVLVSVSLSEHRDIFKWLDKASRLHGYEIKLVEKIVDQLSIRMAKKPPLTLTIKSALWPEPLDHPRKGVADMILSSISKRSRREKQYEISFSEMYYCTNQSLLFRTSETDLSISKMIAGKIVGFQAESTSAPVVEALKSGKPDEVRSYIRLADIPGDIVSKRIDFGVVDTPFAIDAQRITRVNDLDRLRHKVFKRGDFPDSLSEEERNDEYAIAVPRDDELLPVINEIIVALKKDGTLGRLLEEAKQEYEVAEGLPRGSLAGDRPRDRSWECSL